jgi:uroporphyrin-III C-methyltransferase/precorrin-2 dehydrogenase/sirohydrochlorin ferrochelatase
VTVPSPYPIGLVLHDRRVLVVGGGAVATRRVPALVDAGADVVIVSPSLTPALRALADDGRITWRERGFERSDVDGAWLVHAALDDRAAADEVSAAAADQRIFCVRADDREAASAWTPAVARHGGVTVAVLSGGQPKRSMAVRDRIAAGLAAGDLDAAEFTDHVHGGHGGTVALVGAGPGDPELITVRGRRLLNAATVVIADHLAPGLLLDELGPDVEVVDAAKIPYGPQRTQDEINRIMVDRARSGAFVVRLKGGDPYVFGRGGEEVLACADAGIPVLVVPGVTSAIAAPASAGIPITHRGVAHEFVVVSGHVPPDSPESLVDWAAIARLRGTVCVLMGLKNLDAIVRTLLANGRAGSTPAAIVQDGATSRQRVLRAPLNEIAALTKHEDIRSPAVFVVGEVASVLHRPDILA